MTNSYIVDAARVVLVSLKKTPRQYQASSLSTLSQQSMNIALSKAAVEPCDSTNNWAWEPGFNASPRKPRINAPIGVLLMTVAHTRCVPTTPLQLITETSPAISMDSHSIGKHSHITEIWQCSPSRATAPQYGQISTGSGISFNARANREHGCPVWDVGTLRGTLLPLDHASLAKTHSSSPP